MDEFGFPPPLDLPNLATYTPPAPATAQEIRKYQAEHGRCWHCGGSLGRGGACRTTGCR